MFPRTHVAIDHRLCGEPLEIGAGTATVVLRTVPEMAVDATGLVHGGFVFGLADHAAMLAVNHPNVVLAAAHVKFLRPVAVGDRLVASASGPEGEERRAVVRVEVRRGDAMVMSGEFTCVTLDRHVLSSDDGGGSGGGA
ncbi:MAG TPA: hotdog domain-containing protein [Thermoanaerobaculia bacterium]